MPRDTFEADAFWQSGAGQSLADAVAVPMSPMPMAGAAPAPAYVADVVPLVDAVVEPIIEVMPATETTLPACSSVKPDAVRKVIDQLRMP